MEQSVRAKKGSDELEIKKDLWGNPVRTSSDLCLSHINSYYEQVLVYGPHRGVILRAVEADSTCVLSNALAATQMLSIDNVEKQQDRAASFVAAAKQHSNAATAYESLILDAVTALTEGRMKDAVALHVEVLNRFPNDIVSLKRAQTLCFYMGRPDQMLKIALQVLPANRDTAYMHGLLAFSLLEVGRYDEAETAARRALTIENQDIWAQHALCHVLQYKCQFKEAIWFMAENCSSWSICGSFMYSHNWWHLAVCLLEQGCSSASKMVIQIYDTHIWYRFMKGIKVSPQVFINALGLLLRLNLHGFSMCLESRLADLARRLTDESTWHREWLLDLLAIWALSQSSCLGKANALLKSLNCRVDALEASQEVLNSILLLAEALYEYGMENYKAVCDLLGPSFNVSQLKMIGASAEQLDVFDELWCISSLHAGYNVQAIQIANHRVKERSGVPFIWRILEEAYKREGKAVDAQHAAEKAQWLEAFSET
ncbi:hypothetical protein O6H91_19G039100 [Diphasiastrum complanatum]|uniref:Uncharacterized protein n=1 Tax=Diphasiastrum complanatum TaxID=34168 RepID=A0ACC2AUA9_DIPCM|nr:hypothetical protein O6H91_19G039100 [Diphasiastrum complanatum]